MTDDTFKGTGDVIAHVDLGPAGGFDVVDDGDDDWHLKLDVVDSSGSSRSVAGMFKQAREEMGDDALRALLESISPDRARAPGGGPRPSPLFDRPRAFVCDGCNRTWPGKDNQTPDGDDDVCPECDDA